LEADTPACRDSQRGQYCIRDTFITLSLSVGEDPGWVARVCGTSEQRFSGATGYWFRVCKPCRHSIRAAFSPVSSSQTARN